MEFTLVTASRFYMGARDDERSEIDERPRHEVDLDAYWIGIHPVTQEQFRAFVKATGASWSPLGEARGDVPATGMDWYQAVHFCEWMVEQTGRAVRLPTEAEWERAARGSDGRLYPWGDDEPSPTLCNFNGNVGGPSAVGSNSPQGDSPCGCTDMAGNVCEWTWDWYDAGYYGESPLVNPTGPISGEDRVLRGGSWDDDSHCIRSGYRGGCRPDHRDMGVGFRCALGA
jgi:formylglycine-generating enzyme required for sulfatase activity